MQTITSEKTSGNRLARGFKLITWGSQTYNFDLGGGKYNKGTEYLANLGVTNMVYDPFNRTERENELALALAGQYASVTCFNVLNVIREDEEKLKVIALAYRMLMRNSLAFFQVWEGDKTEIGKRTTKGWQENKLSRSYMGLIREHFPRVFIYGKLIVASLLEYRSYSGETPDGD